MVLPYRIIQSELEKGNCWSVLNWIFQMCASVKIPELSPTWSPISSPSHRSAPVLHSSISLFHCSSEELLEIHEVEQLMDHRVCFIFPCFTFSPGSLLRPHRLSAPAWQWNLFASYALRGTSVSTSSAAKHFKQCKFNEQQSNNVPEGMAFFSIPFVSTGALILMSESFLSSPLAAVMWHCTSLHILSERLFLNLLAWCLPWFQRHYRAGILGENKTKSFLVNLITGDNFCSAATVTEEVSN